MQPGRSGRPATGDDGRREVRRGEREQRARLCVNPWPPRSRARIPFPQRAYRRRVLRQWGALRIVWRHNCCPWRSEAVHAGDYHALGVYHGVRDVFASARSPQGSIRVVAECWWRNNRWLVVWSKMQWWVVTHRRFIVVVVIHYTTRIGIRVRPWPYSSARPCRSPC